MASSVEKIIQRVPGWIDEEDLTFSPLGGGITNRNYKIDVGGESFVLRIAGANTDLLGIDRKTEFVASELAGILGIAPEVIYFIQPEGYLVTKFIQGLPLSPEGVKKPGNLKNIVEMLKRFHASDPIPGKFWVPQIVADYSKIAESHHVSFPGNFSWLLECLDQAVTALEVDPLPHCPCHNDLLNENFLVEGQRIFILDWEYAGMGDRYFDLANLSVNHDFNDEQDDLVLRSYFGEVTETSWAHMKIMRIISDYRESMWGLVQMGISELDFDFQGYADKHFERLTNNLEHPNWGQWLEILREKRSA